MMRNAELGEMYQQFDQRAAELNQMMSAITATPNQDEVNNDGK
jgi:hypothetical protein